MSFCYIKKLDLTNTIQNQKTFNEHRKQIRFYFEIHLLQLSLLFRPHWWGEELYTRMGDFCSVNFGRSIY